MKDIGGDDEIILLGKRPQREIVLIKSHTPPDTLTEMYLLRRAILDFFRCCYNSQTFPEILIAQQLSFSSPIDAIPPFSSFIKPVFIEIVPIYLKILITGSGA